MHGVRITPHLFTTTAELDTFVRALKALAAPHIDDPNACLAEPIVFEILRNATDTEAVYLTQHFQSIPATIVSYDNKHMLVEFVIPPEQLTSETDSLEYYFDFLFDGYYGKRPIEHVRITAKS